MALMHMTHLLDSLRKVKVINEAETSLLMSLNFYQFVEAQNLIKSGGTSLPQPQRILLIY
jgi:hypothetical protein